jgi:hypothetical protein
MKLSTIAFGILAAALFSTGCGKEDGDDSDETGSDGNDSASDAGAAIDYCASPITTTDEDGNLLVIAEEKYNYSFESSLEIRSVPVRSLSDIRFDWSDITTDMLGHPFDPMLSVDMMELTLWNYTTEDLLRDINSDNLDTGKMKGIIWLPTNNTLTAGNFLDLLSPSGGAVDDETLLTYVDTVIYTPSDYKYLVMVAEGDSFGQGTKMLSFFEPNPDETAAEVMMDNSSTVLSYTADLSSLTHIPVPPENPNIVLNWMDNTILLNNAMGREWIPTMITNVSVAHYLTKTPKDLEREFLNLELLADETWTIFLSAGQSVNLSRLNTEPDGSGQAFTGIDDAGTWVIALKCGSCSNPAPWFLSILHSCP